MILATKSHADIESVDARLMVDIDLAVLGQPRDEFEAYDVAIQKEYGWVPVEQYRAARAHVLSEFLQRPHIFYTDVFRQRYEATARANLQRKVEELTT